MSALKPFLDLLFNPDELCGPSDIKYGYHTIPVKELLTGKVTLVSPNEKIKTKTVSTDKLILLAVNPMKSGWRVDENVSAFRTFLWEIDVGTLKSQMDYVERLGIPWSAAIYSGNKSIHFVTVLDKDLPDEKTWRLLYQWVLRIATLLDDQCGNPTRSVRIPDAIRPDTGKTQRLIKIKEKVKLEDFMGWLNKYEHLRPKKREKRKVLTGEPDFDKLSRWAKKQFKDGIDFSKGRNAGWFRLACDLAKTGFEEDEALEILTQYFVEESDFKEKEWLSTIKHAFKRIDKD